MKMWKIKQTTRKTPRRVFKEENPITQKKKPKKNQKTKQNKTKKTKTKKNSPSTIRRKTSRA